MADAQSQDNEIFDQLATEDYTLRRHAGEVWLEFHSPVGSVTLAEIFRERGARFVAAFGWLPQALPQDGQVSTSLTVSQEEGTASASITNRILVLYHYDWQGRIYNCVVPAKQGVLNSIAMLYPLADWSEREIHENFGLIFAGRTDTPALFGTT